MRGAIAERGPAGGHGDGFEHEGIAVAVTAAPVFLRAVSPGAAGGPTAMPPGGDLITVALNFVS